MKLVRNKHGLHNHRLYNIWDNMKRRCTNPKHPKYHLYGGRGVTICDEWMNNFKNFYDWALVNGYDSTKELDKDKLYPDKIGMEYSPRYCCFISHQENCNHQRGTHLLTYKGETKNMYDWCKQFGVDQKNTTRRIFKLKWDAERAFNQKKREW